MILGVSRRTMSFLSYLRFASIVIATAALSFAGCGGPTYVTLDGAVLDADQPRDGTLALLSAPSLAIRPGEVALIDVRCTRLDGSPYAGVEVTFAIEGAALDSTLSALSTRTDADGRASGGIVAGTSATSFRVRVVSRASALPVYVDVGVGTSFGTLVVRAPYEGARIVMRRVVDIVPLAHCVDLIASPPEVGARALPVGSDELSIAGLPSTVRYAVLARAESDLALTAQGCVDDIVLETNGAVVVDVPYEDAPLSIDGRYDVTLALDSSAVADVGLEILSRSLSVGAEARGGDASTLLDAVEEALTERVSVAAGTAFADARALDALDEALADRLAVDASAPTAITLRWVGAARSAMGELNVDATLVVAASGASVITTDRITMRNAADGTLSLVPSAIGSGLGVARPLVVSADSSRDTATVESLLVDAPLGAMLLAWLDGVAASDGLTGTAALLGASCGSLRAVLEETPSASACDAECVDAACASAIAVGLDDLRVTAALLDSTTGRLMLAGPLVATDLDGDVRIDGLSGDLAGAYGAGSASPLGPVTGSMLATRAAAAP